MTNLDTLKSLHTDLDTCLQAIQAGHVPVVTGILETWKELISDRIADREAPRYSSYAQNRYLAVLTGWASNPPRHWQELQLTPAEASDAINELKLMGEVDLRGKTYYRITTDKQEKNAALRRQLGTIKGKRKAA